MKKYLLILLTTTGLLLNSCSNGQTQNDQTNNETSKNIYTKLSADEFLTKMKELPSAPIIDVRTHEEYINGHIENALNLDWNGSEFKNQVATIDKTKPVFVYCLSGGRSGAAIKKMQADGFTEIYELKGGMLKWRASSLPETTNETVQLNASTGMTKTQFDDLTNNPDKTVLVDFYADWCAPCKKMKPYLEEISKDMSDKVVVVRVNIDENPALSRELKIDAIPVLHVYKNNQKTWTNLGYIGKEEVVKQLL